MKRIGHIRLVHHLIYKKWTRLERNFLATNTLAYFAEASVTKMKRMHIRLVHHLIYKKWTRLQRNFIETNTLAYFAEASVT
jgi:hypothetical protein